MHSFIIFCTLCQALNINAANDKRSYGLDDGIISVLMKKIWNLEERDREFDRKLEEIDVLRARLDEAQTRLTNMQELEYRLQKAEERIRILETSVGKNNDDCKVNKSASMKISETNGTHDKMDIDFADSIWIRRGVSNMESRQAEIGKKLAELVSFKNRIQTVKHVAATKDIKRTVTRNVAFTAMFSSSPVTSTPGHSLLFDKVDYNEGNAYDAKIGIFTCPVSGTYFFFTNVLSQYNSAGVQTVIVVDGLEKGLTHAAKQGGFDQGCTAAALHCNAGQRVWVQGYAGSEAYGFAFSSFTGILLWPSDPATNSN